MKRKSNKIRLHHIKDNTKNQHCNKPTQESSKSNQKELMPILYFSKEQADLIFKEFNK